MMVKRKAQTATEYLIILAVVIVIALIVVGVMGGIPGIGRGVGTKTSSSYWSSADIAIDAYSITVAGQVTAVVRNNLQKSVTLTAFTIGGTNMATLGTLSPGETTTLTSAATALPCSGSFSHAVSVTYTDLATGAAYTFTGDGHKLEGACAN